MRTRMRTAVVAFACACGAALSSLVWIGAQEKGKRPRDEYLYLAAHFDTDAFSEVAAPLDGNLDGAGNVLDVAALPEGRTFRVLSLRYGEIEFLKPPVTPKAKNALSARGQRISIRTRNVFNLLFVLGVATADTAAAHVELEFEDGRRVAVPFGLSNWLGDARFGEELAIRADAVGTSLRVSGRSGTVRSRIIRSGGQPLRTAPARIWLQRVPIPRAKKLVAVRLPQRPQYKIFALTLAYRDAPVPRYPEPGPPPGPAPAAVLDAEGFPYYYGIESLTPERLALRLEEFGIRVARLPAVHFADPEVLKPSRYPVVAHPCGNTFPEEAAEAIRAYRKAGGVMVLCGIPFTQPMEGSTYGLWFPRGHNAGYLPHEAPLGFGSLGYADAPTYAVEPAEALSGWGFEKLPWGELRARGPGGVFTQVLGKAPLSEKDKITPLVTGRGIPDAVFAAVIRHGACGFEGAVDVWCGQADYHVGGALEPTSLREELFVRAVVWALHLKGAVSDEVWKRASKPLEPQSVSPRFAVPPEPAGARAPFPDPLSAPKEILGVDAGRFGPGEYVLLRSAQGLLARRGVGVYAYENSTALNELKKLAGESIEVESVDLDAVLDRLGTRRAVLVDPDTYGSLNLAAMVAGAEGVLVAYPGFVERYRLSPVADLRGLFRDGAEMLEFAIEHVLPKLDRRLLVFAPPDPEQHTLIDLVTALQLPSFWLPVWGETAAGGIDPPRERRAVRKLLEKVGPGGAVVAAAPHRRRDTDPDPVGEFFHAYGLTYAQASGVTNTVLWRSLPPGEAEAPPLPEIEKPVSGRIYVVSIQVTQDPAYVRLSDPRFLSAAGRPITNPDSLTSTVVSPVLVDLYPGSLRLLKVQNWEFGAGTVSGGTPDILCAAYGPRLADAGTRFMRALAAQAEAKGMAFFLGLSSSGAVTEALKADAVPEGPGVVILEDHPVSSEVLVRSNPVAAVRTLGRHTVFHRVQTSVFAELVRARKEGVLRDAAPYFVAVERRAIAAVVRSTDPGELVEVVPPSVAARLWREWSKRHVRRAFAFIEKGAVWRYHDRGQDLGAAWRAHEFDDSAWKEGPAELGYGDAVEGRPEATVLSFGEDPEAKPITYYFRRSFETSLEKPLHALLLEVLADDGCVVYLNGTECARFNMPEGGITASTRAARALGGGAEFVWNTRILEPGLLRKGRNVLAVEVHQSGPTSSDLSFDLRLTGYRWEAKAPRAEDGE